MIVIMVRLAIAIVVFMLIHRLWSIFIMEPSKSDPQNKENHAEEETKKDVKKLLKCEKCDAYVVKNEVHICNLDDHKE